MRMTLSGIKADVLYMVLIGMLLYGTGCATIATKQVFPVERVKHIQPGATTKQQVLDWFGPPGVVVKKGERVRVRSVRGDGREPRELSFDDILGFFPARHDENHHLVVFRYQYWKSEVPWVAAPFAHLAEEQVTVFSLWVLMNEDTGIVEDSALRTQESRAIPIP